MREAQRINTVNLFWLQDQPSVVFNWAFMFQFPDECPVYTEGFAIGAVGEHDASDIKEEEDRERDGVSATGSQASSKSSTLAPRDGTEVIVKGVGDGQCVNLRVALDGGA